MFGLKKTDRFAGAAVYEKLKERGEQITSVKVSGRLLKNPDGALEALSKERASFIKSMQAQADRARNGVRTYLAKLDKLGLDLPGAPSKLENPFEDLEQLEPYALQIQPLLEKAEVKLPKPPNNIRLLLELKKQETKTEPSESSEPSEPPGAFMGFMQGAWNKVGKGLTSLATIDTETVEETVDVEVQLEDGRKLEFAIPVFDRSWSTVLQTSSALTSGAAACVPLPFVETAANAGHGVLAAVATLPALAVGRGALAKSLLLTSAKKLAIAVPSLIPIVSTIVNTTAAAVDGKQALNSQQRPTVEQLEDLSQYLKN